MCTLRSAHPGFPAGQGVRRGHRHGGVRRGGALQLHTIKTRVESAPGVCNQSTRLKLKCDEPLSNVAFNCNLRHYILGSVADLAFSFMSASFVRIVRQGASQQHSPTFQLSLSLSCHLKPR